MWGYKDEVEVMVEDWSQVGCEGGLMSSRLLNIWGGVSGIYDPFPEIVVCITLKLRPEI